jgi:hypothetical protein
LASQKGKYEVEGWRIRKNGMPFFVTGALAAIRDDNAHLIGFASVIRDATERRDTQEKLVEAREQLAMAQKMEAIGKLTGGIAHDYDASKPAAADRSQRMIDGRMRHRNNTSGLEVGGATAGSGHRD